MVWQEDNTVLAYFISIGTANTTMYLALYITWAKAHEYWGLQTLRSYISVPHDNLYYIHCFEI